MLRVRIWTALLGALITVPVIWYGGVVLTLTAWALAMLALKEYRDMLQSGGSETSLPLMALWMTLLLGAAHWHSHLLLIILPAVLPILFGLLLLTHRDDFRSILFTMVGTWYVAIGFGSMVLLRQLDAVPWYLPNTGLFWLVFAILGTWLSDIGAFFLGRRYGRRPLAPAISPNKTWEGFVGGGVVAVLGLLLYAAVFDHYSSQVAALAVLVAMAAPLGDLFESSLKRYCSVKDSGTLLPGHGGILDRFDSLMFVAPVLYAGIMLFLGGI